MRLPLDQNFPEPILKGLESWMGEVQLVPLRTIDHRLTTLDDRGLLIALKQLGYDGLVTLNYRMLRNPKELAAVLKTKLAILRWRAWATIRSVRLELCFLISSPPSAPSGRAGLACSGCALELRSLKTRGSCSSV